MNIIIESVLHTLEKSEYLLNKLTDEQLCDDSIAPYKSSIGTHIRHILDFYDCVLKSKSVIDLTTRNRNKEVESRCCIAKDYLSFIIGRLKRSDFDFNSSIIVIDDLGLGEVEIPYTLSAVFSHANSHTIHHYAIINYILEGLNICFEDSDFGYNPTTPKKVIVE